MTATPTTEIPVTDKMVDAGMEELGEHHFGDDPRYVIECVFRAMAYKALESTK